MNYLIYSKKISKKLRTKASRKTEAMFLLLMTLFFFPQQSYAQPNSAALNYLLISPATKANSMAGAFTAIANDASAIHYNPAGLSRLKFGALAYDHGYPEFKDYGSYHFLGAAMVVPQVGGIGIGYKYIDLGKQIRTSVTGQEIGKFESYEWSLYLSYGKTIAKNIAIGVSFNYNYSHLSPLGAGVERGIGTAKGVSFDIGLIYDGILSQLCYSQPYQKNYGTLFSNIINSKRRIPPGISIGLAILNMGPKISYIKEAEGEPLPQNLKLGIAWNFFDTKDLNFVFACDAEKLLIHLNRQEKADPFYQAIFTSWADQSLGDELNEFILRFGIELSYSKYISLRGGRYVDVDYYSGRDLRYWSYGFSIGTDFLRLNFSWDHNEHIIGYPLQPTKFIGVSFNY